MSFLRYFLLACLLWGCSSPRGRMKVGVDASWYPLDFGSQTSLVNGYTEDLLLEMARYSGVEFEVVSANWDSLVDGLRQKKYDAILSSMPRYEYNLATYDFSDNMLNLGSVLIVPLQAKERPLGEMETVGMIANDSAALTLEKYPAIIIRSYNTIPDLLNAVVAGEIQGAVLSQIPAVTFVRDLYAGKLKVASGPMTDAGLHLVASKGKMGTFNKTLEALRKRKTVDALLKKWQLSL